MVHIISCPGQKRYEIDEDDYAWSMFDDVDSGDINPVVRELTNSLNSKIMSRFSIAQCRDGCNKSSTGLAVNAAPVGRPYRRWWSLWLVSIQKIHGHAEITVICTPVG